MLACFIALLAHTMAYAGFLEDPLTWVLLAIGGSLAAAPRGAGEPEDARRESEPSPTSAAQARA